MKNKGYMLAKPLADVRSRAVILGYPQEKLRPKWLSFVQGSFFRRARVPGDRFGRKKDTGK